MATTAPVREPPRGVPDIAAGAALIGDRSRAQVLLALCDGGVRPASELAMIARVSRPTVSSHLAKLVAAGYLECERRGRYSYYRIKSDEVASAIAALQLIAPPEEIKTLRQATIAESVRAARLCYDHLAGVLGCAVTDALLADGSIEDAGGQYALTPSGCERLERLSIDVAALRRQRRELSRACLDWSEHRCHLAGAAGAALATELVRRGWLRPAPMSRALHVTPKGSAGLRDAFGIEL